MKNRTRFIFLIAIVALLCAGCWDKSDSANGQTAKLTQRVAKGFNQSQPPPVTPWSQKRQNLIEIERMEQTATPTFTFAFQQGVDHPVFQCDSIGLPIPSTDQLTNPQAIDKADMGEPLHWVSDVISQMETTGVFTGDSTGTHNICLNSKGQPYDFYFEGFVAASTQPLQWDNEKQMLVEVPGTDTTGKITTGKK